MAGLDAQMDRQTLPELFNAAGFVSDNATNLRRDRRRAGAVDMYTRFAAEAQKAGATDVADSFRSIRDDEKGHFQVFSHRTPPPRRLKVIDWRTGTPSSVNKLLSRPLGAGSLDGGFGAHAETTVRQRR
jgi:hypothetical protein